MRLLSFALVTALILAGVGDGQTPKSPAAAVKPQVYAGKVVLHTAPKGQSGAKPGERRVDLVADDGTAYRLVEDNGSRMLFLDARLRDRPVRLTALPTPDNKSLQVVRVQTVKNGKVYDVDYWCEICQISSSEPGHCVCCGDETVLRERPAQ
jgi:hypothetical protein